MVCASCSGWGHLPTCWRKSKKRVQSKLGCPTQDLIDQIYRHGINKIKYATLKVDVLPQVQKVPKLFPPLTVVNNDGVVSYTTKSLKRKRTDAGEDALMDLITS